MCEDAALGMTSPSGSDEGHWVDTMVVWWTHMLVSSNGQTSLLSPWKGHLEERPGDAWNLEVVRTLGSKTRGRGQGHSHL